MRKTNLPPWPLVLIWAASNRLTLPTTPPSIRALARHTGRAHL